MKNSFVYWLPMIVLGMANGFFRGFILNRYFEEAIARQLSTGILIVLLTIYVSLIFNRLRIRSASEALMVGAVWAFLTFVFETLLGYFVSGLSMSEILREYNIFEGRLWVLVMITLTFLPLIFYSFRKRS